MRLLANLPAKGYRQLIVRYPYQDDFAFAFAYAESARRLAASYEGEPIDDTILLPYLMLYRQAFELQMKAMIRRLAGWRRMYYSSGDVPDTAAVNDLFKTKIKHNLHQLLNELRKHYVALAHEAFPASVEQVILDFHQADAGGVAFRYSGLLPDTQDNVDFVDLARLLDDAWALLIVTMDPLSAGFDAMPGPGEW